VRLAVSTCIASILSAALGSAVRGDELPIGSRLRCLDREAARVLDRAKAWSPSVRTLADRIERSDLVVYIRMDGLLTRHKGETRFISSAPGARYVMVGLSPRADERDHVAMLGHELQHVSEIADAPEARDVLAVEALFRRIGWPGSSANGYETGRAIDMGRQVAREVRAVEVVAHDIGLQPD